MAHCITNALAVCILKYLMVGSCLGRGNPNLNAASGSQICFSPSAMYNSSYNENSAYRSHAF